MKNIRTIKQVCLIVAGTLLSVQMAQASMFQIADVASWDTLNMRAQPGASASVVGKIPANGQNIRHLGKQVKVGNTTWVNIIWQGRNGWVSSRYIRPMPASSAAAPASSAAPQAPASRNTASAQPPAAQPQAVTAVRPTTARTPAASNSKGKWVLECGDRSPFWRVVVHPKALEVNKHGQAIGMLPITYEKQDRNRWNTAMKTVLKASNGPFSTNMTIKYTKQCDYTLRNERVHYWVEANLGGDVFKGCCRAVRIE